MVWMVRSKTQRTFKILWIQLTVQLNMTGLFHGADLMKRLRKFETEIATVNCSCMKHEQIGSVSNTRDMLVRDGYACWVPCDTNDGTSVLRCTRCNDVLCDGVKRETHTTKTIASGVLLEALLAALGYLSENKPDLCDVVGVDSLSREMTDIAQPMVKRLRKLSRGLYHDDVTSHTTKTYS